MTASNSLPELSQRELVQLRRAAEDAIDAANSRFGPFIEAVANPRMMLALVDMAMKRLPAQSAGQDPAAEAEYESWMAHLRSTLGPALPACTTCCGTGVMVEDGTTYVCECGGSGVQMDDNEPYAGKTGWKLHRCPDGEQCRTDYPGGCAGGWCAHFGVEPENLYSNIRGPAACGEKAT